MILLGRRIKMAVDEVPIRRAAQGEMPNPAPVHMSPDRHPWN